ncbi:MAG: HAMP domain-containing histidine kinase [Bdellovibrionaceae bacterium]|nr:HAMP domain-containing histidine kinase [Pseudobdellovibrionaceae bacterium]
MLYEFLESHRAEILALAEEKTLVLAGPLPSSIELERGLPVFFNHLIQYLKNSRRDNEESRIVAGAAEHGRELLRLNYTLSHVVHAYGAMCQAVTELAQRRHAAISAQEFNDLNMCLDIAIAAAVSEFQYHSVQASEEREVQHLGILVHELRNALSSATVAQDMIQQGLVGNSGSTAKVLVANLARMRDLIDRSLSELRMRADPQLHIEKFNVTELMDQILLTAQGEARTKRQTLRNESAKGIELESDRQLLLSAIANLTQNALKYSKIGGLIIVRAASSGKNVVIEVEDECGGLNSDAIKNLFKPFVSGGFDQSGLGLGLTIVQRAVTMLQGKISHQNNPGRGCGFRIEVPKVLVPVPVNRAVEGLSSAHPKPSRP